MNKVSKVVQDLNAKRAQGKKLTDKEQRELKQSTAEFRKYQAAVLKADKSIGRFQRNVGNYPKVLGSAVGALKGLIGAFGIIEGLRFGFNFAKEAVLIANASKGVDLAFSTIANSTNILERARTQTRGLISDLDLKKSANEFKNFNLNVEELPTLLEFVSLRAIQTGKDVDGLRDSLVEGLAKESTLRIDNLGISVKQLNEELEQTGDFTSAVASIARRELAKAGSIIDDSVSGVQQWNVALENTKSEFGKLLNSSNLGLLAIVISKIK